MVAPDQSKTAGAEEAAANRDRSFSDFLIPVLSAIGTGIGVLGFVMFFGGFILWARFKAAGLPANEAVAKVPRSDLIATGASFLVPGILAALGTVVIAFAVWDRFIGKPRRDRQRQVEDEYAEASERLADLEVKRRRLEARQEKAGRGEKARLEKRLAHLTNEEIPAQRDARKEAAEARDQTPTRSHRKERAVSIAIFASIAIVVGLYLIPRLEGLSFDYLLLFGAVVVGAVTATVVIASMTEHFAWVSACVFLSVGMIIAGLNYVRTATHPKVSPVAALSGHTPVVGFFVAETGDALYVGRPQLAGPKAEADSMGFDRARATLIRVPKESVVEPTIGPLMSGDKAYRRSLQLAMALCRRAKAAAAEAARVSTAESAGDSAAGGKGGKQKKPAPLPVACSLHEENLLANRLRMTPGKRR